MAREIIIKYAVLGSGSSGNSYVFAVNDFGIIVDNAFIMSDFYARLAQAEIAPEHIRFIFLTHTHQDHCAQVGSLSKELAVPLVFHKHSKIKNAMLGARPFEKLVVEHEQVYTFNEFSFTPFALEHDAPFASTYLFDILGWRCSILTDTGRITRKIYDHALRSKVLFLEANYDPLMLEQGPYPVWLKKRVASDKGHLSNTAALSFCNSLFSDPNCEIEKVYFIHLSKENNSPEVLEQSIKANLKVQMDYTICPNGVTIKSSASQSS